MPPISNRLADSINADIASLGRTGKGIGAAQDATPVAAPARPDLSLHAEFSARKRHRPRRMLRAALTREGHLDHWIMPQALARHATRPLREEPERLIRENEARVRENQSLAAQTALLRRSRSHAQSVACSAFRP